MKRAEKVESVEALQRGLRDAPPSTVLAEYRGLTALQMNRLRKAVREADGRCRVAKNTPREARGRPTRAYEKLGRMLRGPDGAHHRLQDPVAIAKVAVKLAEELPKLEIKGAVLDGAGAAAGRGEGAGDAAAARGACWRSCSGLLQAPGERSSCAPSTSRRARLARLVDALAKRAGGGAAEPALNTRTSDGSSRKERQAMEVTREQVKDFLKNMSLMDAAALVKELENELGVSAAAPVAVAAAGGAPAGGARPRRRSRRRTSPSCSRAPATRRSRSSRWCASSPASASRRPRTSSTARPKPVKEAVPKAEAEAMKKKLEEAGGTVELK